MAKFATKADRAFEEQLHELLKDGRRKPDPGPVMAISAEAAERYKRELETPLPLDAEATIKLFTRYGSYLELVDGDDPLGGSCEFEFTVTRSGGVRSKTVDEMVDEAHQRIHELGDNLMEVFHENNNKKDES